MSIDGNIYRANLLPLTVKTMCRCFSSGFCYSRLLPLVKRHRIWTTRVGHQSGKTRLSAGEASILRTTSFVSRGTDPAKVHNANLTSEMPTTV